jgi:hypothetical protein
MGAPQRRAGRRIPLIVTYGTPLFHPRKLSGTRRSMPFTAFYNPTFRSLFSPGRSFDVATKILHLA